MSSAARYSLAGMIGHVFTRKPIPSGLDGWELIRTIFRLSTVSDSVIFNGMTGSTKMLVRVDERVSIRLYQ